MPRLAYALALVLLTAGLAGCVGDEEADTPESGDSDLDGQSRPSDDASDESSEDAGDSGENEEESGEGEDKEDDSDTSDEEPQPTDEGPRVEVAWFNGSVRGQSAPVLGPFCLETCDNQFEFAVFENVTGMVAEIAWETEASILFDLDIPYGECEAGLGEDCPPASTSGGEGHLSIRVTDPSDVVAGNWTASAWAEDSPTEAVDFTIAVSLLQDEVPQGYSELAS